MCPRPSSAVMAPCRPLVLRSSIGHRGAGVIVMGMLTPGKYDENGGAPASHAERLVTLRWIAAHDRLRTRAVRMSCGDRMRSMSRMRDCLLLRWARHNSEHTRECTMFGCSGVSNSKLHSRQSVVARAVGVVARAVDVAALTTAPHMERLYDAPSMGRSARPRGHPAQRVQANRVGAHAAACQRA